MNGFYMPTYTNIPTVLKDEMDCIPRCERCGSSNMRVISDPLDMFDGWWKCIDCGLIRDEEEEE